MSGCPLHNGFDGSLVWPRARLFSPRARHAQQPQADCSQGKIAAETGTTEPTPSPSPNAFSPGISTSREDPRLTLSKFPVGFIRFDNQLFDARGLIQLSSTQMETQLFLFPKRVSLTAPAFKATRIHFLHGTVWPAPDGTHIADYVLHYSDHQQHVFPVLYGNDLRDWNIGSDPNTPAPRGRVAWSGWQPPYAFRVYETTWTNPVPALDITGIEFVSQMSSSAPFLIAISVD